MTGRMPFAERYRVRTEPLRTERRLELVLLLLVAALLLLLGVGALRLVTLGPPAPVLPAADSLAVGKPLRPVTPSQEQASELRERPLFWASRRPAPEPGAAQEQQAQSKAGQIDGIRLVGVFGSGSAAGIMVTVNDSARKRLRLGDKVNGWKLERVAGNEAVLSAGARSHTLVLGKPGAGNPVNNKRRRRAR
jgi:hypothetical protein